MQPACFANIHDAGRKKKVHQGKHCAKAIPTNKFLLVDRKSDCFALQISTMG